MSLISDAKEIGKVLQEAGKINEYEKILGLLEKINSLQEEKTILKEKNTELEDKLKINGEIEFKNNFYYLKDVGPYCSRCWDKNDDLIRCIPNNTTSNIATCPECKNYANYTGRERVNRIIHQDMREFL